MVKMIFIMMMTLMVNDIRDFKIQRRGRQREREKKNKRFYKQTTTLHVHHVFLYISFLFLHDFDVKNALFPVLRGT